MTETKQLTKIDSEERSLSLTPNSSNDMRSSVTAGQTDNQDETSPRTFKEKMIILFVAFRPLISMLVIDVGIPLAIYYVTKIWLSQLVALILSGIPPLLHTAYTFIKKRRVEILGCIVVLSYVVSAILSLITGDVRATLLRDSTVTALISVMFFITLIPLKTRWFTIRPMVFLISQQMFSNSPPITWTDREGTKHSAPVMDFNWEHVHVFRKFCYLVTFAWSVLLMCEFIAKVIMVESSLDVDRIVLYGNIMVIAVVIVMTIATTISSHFMKKRAIAVITEWKRVNDYSDKLP